MNWLQNQGQSKKKRKICRQIIIKNWQRSICRLLWQRISIIPLFRPNQELEKLLSKNNPMSKLFNKGPNPQKIKNQKRESQQNLLVVNRDLMSFFHLTLLSQILFESWKDRLTMEAGKKAERTMSQRSIHQADKLQTSTCCWASTQNSTDMDQSSIFIDQ